MGKEKVKWTEVPSGTLNGATQRFWVELGDYALRIAVRINNDPKFLADLATSAINLATSRTKILLEHLFSFSTKEVKEFIAKESFVEGKTTDGVSIVWLGENFKKNFLGKIERNVKAVELKVNRLLEAARDLSKEGESGIIPQLGGKHEIMLAHFFQLLAYKQQKKDFTWTVAYICDENGVVLWVVDADWSTGLGGCYVNAYSVESSGKWVAGAQVVSR